MPKEAKMTKNCTFKVLGAFSVKPSDDVIWRHGCCGPLGRAALTGTHFCHFEARKWPLLAWPWEVAARVPHHHPSRRVPRKRKQVPSVPNVVKRAFFVNRFLSKNG